MAQLLFLSPPRRADGSRALFNNASLSLASYLARRGVTARIAPLLGTHWREDLQAALAEHVPDHAAISCKWWDTLYGATEVAKQIKAFRPETRTVAGGQTAAAFARDLVSRRHFDAVVSGDGEKPLVDLARGAPEGNLTFLRGEETVQLPLTYVQPRGGSEDLSLLDDLTEIAPADLLREVGYNAPYVWTGKGCQSTCLYCGGSALGHKTLFGRTGYAYRPPEQTIRDMEVLGRWSGDVVMFDFDPVTDPTRREYYRQLMRQLPRGRFHVAFYCWSLPDDEFIAEAAATFRSCLIGIDAQTYSEPLRARLARRAWIKPFASDADLDHAVATCQGLPNCAVAMYGIVGLATETADDVARAEEFLKRLLDRYGEAFHELEITPLSIEPGALLARDPAKYGMVALRNTFDDYLAFTRFQYHLGAGFHEAPFEPGLPHPFGVHRAGDAPDRVWRDYRRLKALIGTRREALANAAAYEALSIGAEGIALTLRNRSVYQDVWRLIPWAAGEALDRGLPRVEVAAALAHVNVPAAPVLTLDERFAWARAQLARIREAIAAGHLELRIRGSEGQRWGALADCGAEITSEGRGSC
ncbi:MAG: cobalamin-dependent protein [Candidatus Sericytochromatia bacterium]|nr:cobalamin-dependent protein [Candidatus Tanganyikabacteria bacterium]